ncbi:response regulator, partial [Desulfosarcina sp.]|uniref:response regulator n=1 Tax=Desulfosarcina sp. TaxID=2027861 RepID=UPI003561DB46
MKMNSKASILVVDDEAFIRNLVCLMLSKIGYATTSARDAIEALEFIQSVNGFQLVLTDINMPIIDGWAFALRVKALQPGLPIVALTGESPDRILPRLKGSGISHALFKPITLNLLEEALSSILDS